MLPIGHNNIFYGDINSQQGISRLLDMYDDDYNWIFLHRTSSILSSKMTHRKSITYSTSSLNKFTNGNNLFRVDMVVVESNTDILPQLRKYIKIPIIVTTSHISRFNLSDYDHIYEFRSQSLSSTTGQYTSKQYVSSNVFHSLGNKYFVVLDGDPVDIDDIKSAFIRDRKIDGLLG